MNAFYALLITFSISSGAFAETTHHLPLDLNGYEYQALLKQQKGSVLRSFGPQSSVDAILKVGERNLNWLKHINANRKTQLSFSTPANRAAYPIDTPNVYNDQIINAQFTDLLKTLPEPMKKVLINNENFTDDTPIDEADYLQFGFLVDKSYEAAARWTLMEPDLANQAAAKVNDVRGYYFLNKLADRDEKLAHFSSLAKTDQEMISGWLTGQCFNKEADDYACTNALATSLQQNKGSATAFYQAYLNTARKTYESFFVIPAYGRRTDIVWNKSTHNIATVPFIEVSDLMKSYLHNVELEWQWKGWQLLLNYVKSSDTEHIPHLTYQQGVTPHVNTLGGNEITLDANQPISEWDAQWTIRHEFGHVLGFPDCYVEFYDPSLSAMVNYQLDTTNLMCSRRGRLKEIHFDEMKRNYFIN